MARNLTRVCGAVLATLVIGGAATTVGAATASAAGVIAGFPTGSAGQTPWPVDEAIDQLRTCGPSYPYPDRGPCYFNYFNNSGTLGDYQAKYFGPDEVEPGAEAEFTALISADMAAFDVPNPDTDVDVTSVTYQPPDGFEFVSVDVVAYKSSTLPHTYTELPSTVSVDPDSGRITVSAPSEGWALIPQYAHNEWSSTSVIFEFTLRAPEGRTPGRTGGFTFTGTSVPESNGLVATGITRSWPELAEGTGS